MKMNKKLMGWVCVLGLLAAAARGQEREEYPIASLTNNVRVNMEWTAQFAYAAAAGAHGSVEGTTNDWYDSGTSISNQAVADLHYQFTGWTGVPTGQENNNPLLFTLDGPYTNVTATFGLVDYGVEVVSAYSNWFGTNVIGNPAGAGSYAAFSSVTVSVDRIVVDPENPGRRLRFDGFGTE